MKITADWAALREKIHHGRPLTLDERAAVLSWLPSDFYRFEIVGVDAGGRPLWRVQAPLTVSIVFASRSVGLHYLRYLVARGAAGEQPANLDPDSANPRQAVDRACRTAIEQLRAYCPPLADLLDRALTVGTVARLLLPPHAIIETGNDLATKSAGFAA